MKALGELKKEKEEKYSALFKSVGLFWAFSDSQFAENKTPLPEGDKYVSIGAGGYLPKSKALDFHRGVKEIHETFEKELSENNLREKHIDYELANHECYYTGDIEGAVMALGDGYTVEEIRKVYNANYGERNSY